MKTDKLQHNNRILWTCPVCGSKYRIPAGNDPDLCPQCQELSPPPIIPPIITGVAPPPVFRRRRRVVPVWLRIGLGVFFAAGVIALAVVLFWPGARESLTQSVAQSVADAKTRNAVREYLRENLNNPDFDEVRWWPAEPLPGAEARELFGTIWTPLGYDSGFAIRLKYRQKAPFGVGQMLSHEVFFVVDGRVMGRCNKRDFRSKAEMEKRKRQENVVGKRKPKRMICRSRFRVEVSTFEKGS